MIDDAADDIIDTYRSDDEYEDEVVEKIIEPIRQRQSDGDKEESDIDEGFVQITNTATRNVEEDDPANGLLEELVQEL